MGRVLMHLSQLNFTKMKAIAVQLYPLGQNEVKNELRLYASVKL